MCPIISDIKFDHLVKVVLPGLSYAKVSFPLCSEYAICGVIV